MGLIRKLVKIRVEGGSMFPSADFNQNLCCVGLDSQRNPISVKDAA